MKSSTEVHPQLSEARRAMVGSLTAIGLFSGVVNLLMLTGPLFMLQVYDRVLASQSVSTLAALAVLAAGLYGFMALIDAARTRLLVTMGHKFEQRLSRVAFDSTIAETSRPAQGRNAIRDVEQIRSFLSGQGAAALFDMPWMPIYLGLVFALHVWLGIVGILGAVVLLAGAVVTDRIVRRATLSQSEQAGRRARLTEASRRNAETVRALGMQSHLASAWQNVNDRFLQVSARAALAVGLSSSATKVFRLGLQSAILAVAAYLAIHNELSPGSIVAASVIMSRGLQPIETLVGSWRGIVGAGRAWQQLKCTLAGGNETAQLELPDAKSSLTVEGLIVVPPGAKQAALKGVGFGLSVGEALAVIGPTGGGKSTLARALVSAWSASRGTVRLDGVPMDQFRPEDLGRQIGYLPQDVELFEGTIAQNIARFDPDALDENIVAAAMAAGVHELVANLEGGYGAMVGERGAALSGGQRQRIALARALYGDPFLIVLDEPNSNLDSTGEAALNAAIVAAKGRGAIVVVIAHRATVLGAVDKILVMENGQVAAFGSRDDVLQRMRAENQATVREAQPQTAGGVGVMRGAAPTAPQAAAG
ncbi:MAG: type I secretion system permease/ATPase [Sedimentitalea sp.]|uniref:type I secretion system permease/ATPase n=1 Tax=Sedimentitalea sp. TaxID=2048915 RepID=UPI0032638E1A